MQVTDFGTSGPHAAWQATDAVLYAMSTALSRSGPTTGSPVLPPSGIASATAAVQAAWAALVAYYHRLRCGSRRLHRLLPVRGGPAVPRSAVRLRRSGRGRAEAVRASCGAAGPATSRSIRCSPCRDGFVRICLLSARQWRGMRAWLGEPEQFADPKFETIAARYAASEELNAAIAELFAPQTMDDAGRRGAAARRPDRRGAHARRRAGLGALPRGRRAHRDRRRADGTTLTVPAGPFVVDGRHAGHRTARVRRSVPTSRRGSTTRVRARQPTGGRSTAGRSTGLRILDLGVIVAGGELGRLFADLGAEVIKVESAAYPDGLRQTPPGQPMSRSWALTHRNEYSLGLDLRHPEGAALFRRLVAECRRGVRQLQAGNPCRTWFLLRRAARAESAASCSPRAAPSARPDRGVSGWATARWCGRPPASAGCGRPATPADPSFYDATTIFPDHVVAQAHRDRRAGRADQPRLHRSRRARAHLAGRSGHQPARHDLCGRGRPRCGSAVVDDERGPRRLSVRRRRRMVRDLGAVRRRPRAAGQGHRMSELPDERNGVHRCGVAVDGRPGQGARSSQRCRTPACPPAPMNRAVDVLADPQVMFRRLYTDMVHPLLDAPMTQPRRARAATAASRRAAAAGARCRASTPARSAEACSALTPREIDRLIADGVLFSWPEPDGSTRPGHDVHRSQNTGTRRLRPGQPARRQTRPSNPST